MYKRLTERRETPLVMSMWGGTSKELRIYNRLAELEDKIENGTLIDITEKFITEEEIKNKTRYLICEHYLTKMVVDFAANKIEAEQKLEKLQNERS